MRYSLYLLLLLLFTVSCGNQEKDYLIDYPHLKDKVVDLNEHLIAYNDASKNREVLNNKKTIVNIVDGTCSRCIQELKDWQAFIDKHMSDEDVNYVFIAQGQHDFYFEYNVLKKDFLKMPIYLDPEYKFTDSNDLIDVKAEHTMILDERNKILFLGSPVFNEEKEKQFFKVLNQ
ncbi:redoxin [Roseivirga ehrenbergii]|uniref:Redoxin domain-containing protein n=1 Tax=Roseivirga ehrenbergii (strain DSM 102268 / JCM 13514 / KCTC 12282 / NCIMB 14502 / KMM 6017) TaxID=279360 RepID=A0A150XLG9_ROSEK|nr:redoxin family protein [Roseivirga ehrenbergii]KYG79570.1 hypothetical protein MB14_17055 [Roseivirga ehrenbergii]TCL01044.1 redoxin [Roseivirga ehrenbergii]